MIDDVEQTPQFRSRCAQLAAHLVTLPDKPEETASSTLRALWHLASGRALSVEAAAEVALPSLDADAEQRLEVLVVQRLSGIPLAHLTGRQRFMGLEMLAGKEALIPRRETELLASAALARLHEMAAVNEHALVIDVCTGSGNLALALAHQEPTVRFFASDVSSEAIDLARRNARHLGLEDRLDLRVGDLMEPFNEPRFHAQVDLLVCNPPYISTGRVGRMHREISGHEPPSAFDGGALGISILLRLIRDAPRYVKAGGSLAFEVGAGQGPSVIKRLEVQGAFAQLRLVKDGSGEIRAILASR